MARADERDGIPNDNRFRLLEGDFDRFEATLHEIRKQNRERFDALEASIDQKIGKLTIVLYGAFASFCMSVLLLALALVTGVLTQ
jgi:hypothetical protein